MSDLERHDYAVEADKLNPGLHTWERSTQSLQALIIQAEEQLAQLREKRETAFARYREIFSRQEIFRKLAANVALRERMDQQTSQFPLIHAINTTALAMVLETQRPEAFHNAMEGGQLSFIMLPASSENPAQQVRGIYNGDNPVAPLAIIQAASYGGTGMAFFPDGIAGRQNRAIVIGIGDGSAAAHLYNFTRRTEGEYTLLVQGECMDPGGQGFSAFYSDLPEIGLRKFMGDKAYQDALVLMQST